MDFFGSRPRRPIIPAGEWAKIATSLEISATELALVQGLFRLLKDSAIARQLEVSPETVRTYYKRLYAKLNVSGRVDLVLRVVEEYLFGPPLSCETKMGLAERFARDILTARSGESLETGPNEA